MRWATKERFSAIEIAAMIIAVHISSGLDSGFFEGFGIFMMMVFGGAMITAIIEQFYTTPPTKDNRDD